MKQKNLNFAQKKIIINGRAQSDGGQHHYFIYSLK